MTIDFITKLFLANSIVRRVTNAALKQAGHAWKYEHLVFLAAIPAGKGVPSKHIAAELFGNDQTAMRRIQTDLENAKLIQLKRESEDRRHRRVHITLAGREMLEALNLLASDSMHMMLMQDEEDIVADASDMLDHLRLQDCPCRSLVA